VDRPSRTDERAAVGTDIALADTPMKTPSSVAKRTLCNRVARAATIFIIAEVAPMQTRRPAPMSYGRQGVL